MSHVSRTKPSQPTNIRNLMPLDTKNTSEEKSWNEMDSYQQISEREKKVVNQAPSDPRRRRRLSESSATKQSEPPPSIMKLPRSDEPPTKLKRSTSRTTSVTRKYLCKVAWGDSNPGDNYIAYPLRYLDTYS